MIRMTDSLKTRRQPRHEEARARNVSARVDREQARDISRLYTARIWL